jgi:hypothetical protein
MVKSGLYFCGRDVCAWFSGDEEEVKRDGRFLFGRIVRLTPGMRSSSKK